MKIVAIGLIIALLATLLLLSLMRVGVTEGSARDGIQNQETQKAIEDGIYASLQVNPENGVLIGDVLRVELVILYDKNKALVEDAKLSENYAEFKEHYLTACEEYSTPVIKQRELERNISEIRIVSEFQCWHTEEETERLQFLVPYALDKNSIVLSIHTTVRFVKTADPSSEPRRLAKPEYNKAITNLRFATAYLFIFLGLCAFSAMLYRSIRNAKVTPNDLGNKPIDYLEQMLNEVSDMLEKGQETVAHDNLYHLCLRLETKGYDAKDVQPIKIRLQKGYKEESDMDADLLSQCIAEIRKITKNKGDAK